ncbi:MAG TPA: hypothetical protein VF665_25120 [Longimicrobium sp.]|jgi:hypothetical protein|uniref:hypothetical protein n=1 Tax=Longimicrobium sp. TaxID=2029185 RepID=UPI002ED7BCF9
MTKLTLRLEDLTVDSFATADAADPRGTAHGHMMITVPTEDTAGPPCTGESCRDICSYQICPAAPVLGAAYLASEPAATEPVDTGNGVCLTCELTCARC